MMAKMKIAESDRIKVKLECLKMMFGLELDDARNELIAGFVGTYLKLNQEEEILFEQEAKRLNLPKATDLELFWTDWHEKGYSKGELQGRQEGEKTALANMVLLQLRRKLGEIPGAVEATIRKLETPQLEKLGGDLLDFINMSQLEAWLQGNQPLIAK
jgi:hypothetical protein